MYLKEYNSSFQKLNTSTLTQISPKSRSNEVKLPREINLSFKERSITLQNTGRNLYKYHERDEIDNTLKLSVEVNLAGAINYREQIDELFHLGESYYLNGNIRSKGIGSWLGFSINKGYKYDKEGNLIETIDYDEGYEFNYEKVLGFCRKNNIELQLNLMNKLTNVILENGRKVWNIHYFNQKTNKIDLYQLDGHTGEIIKKELGGEIRGFIHDISKPKE